MRGFTFSVLVVLLWLTNVFPQEHHLSDTGDLVMKTKQSEMFVPVTEPRHIAFRPMFATRQRNRELQKRLEKQRRRYKLKKLSNRRYAHTGRFRKSLWEPNKYEVWTEKPSKNVHIFNVDLSRDEDSNFPLYSTEDERIPVKGPAPNPQAHPALLLGSVQNVNTIANSVKVLLSRPRRNVNSNSSETKESSVANKDTDDVRPSPDVMLMFPELASNRPIIDAPDSNSTYMQNNANQTSSDEETMETAENVLFHPLFVHRLKKADRNRRRQQQMRRQNRPKKPQKQQFRPQLSPTARPQQRPQYRPQQISPQRPVQSTSQKKKPQSTRRVQYYYVAAAGPLGQWVYYPYYYYY